MTQTISHLGFASLFFLGLLVGAGQPAAGQACPHQFLFSVGDSYFYTAKLCSTGQVLNVIFVYSTVVDTGCGNNNGCVTALSTMSVLNQPQVVGDPPGAAPAEAKFKKVPPEAPLLTEFGRSPISVWTGYPKYVKATVNNGERYFKLFRASHTPAGGQRMELGFGIEVTGLPPGVQPLNAANVDVLAKRLKLTVSIDGQPLAFETLYEEPESSPPPPSGN